MGAMPMGAPGWPELAFAGISTAKQRIVLMHFQSSSEYVIFERTRTDEYLRTSLGKKRIFFLRFQRIETCGVCQVIV